ncbi:DUF2147 domain-containing protein [Iodidimonas sp. SYSU 1G8]|uniref:DUF2147 domain-containing protein n=1 Tax=Iodidimonas sp. SYSU 1G8 TaxID=3133967 RepID=UPI0031FF1940
MIRLPRWLILALVLAPFSAGADDAGAIHGFWSSPEGGRIEIRPCGEALCGHIRDDGTALPGEPTYDGHLLLENFRYIGGLSWEDGTIHDPRAGRSYRSKLNLLDEKQLKVRGCVWIFCGSQVWTRIE